MNIFFICYYVVCAAIVWYILRNQTFTSINILQKLAASLLSPFIVVMVLMGIILLAMGLGLAYLVVLPKKGWLKQWGFRKNNWITYN